MNPNLELLVKNHSKGDNRLRTVVLEGGTRSGKTYAALEYIVSWCMQQPRLIANVFREDQTTCRRTVALDFREIMERLGAWDDNSYNKQSATYYFDNGSKIGFHGTQDANKLKGLKQDVAFLNEAMEISYESYRQISFRTRLLTICDFNPSLTLHWIWDRVLSKGPKEVAHLRSTYLDNPHLTRGQVAEIEALNPAVPENVEAGTADAYLWDVYGLGRRGRREGRIFDNFSLDWEWPDRMSCERWGFGLDFGSVDPTALVECALWNDCYYMRERIYETGLIVAQVSTNSAPSIEQRLEELKVPRDARIWADPARPDSIRHLQAVGWNVLSTPRPARDSVVMGLNLMQSRPIKLMGDSINLLREFEQYSWRESRTRGLQAVPEDANNHGIDAARMFWSAEIYPGFGSRGEDGDGFRPAMARSALPRHGM